MAVESYCGVLTQDDVSNIKTFVIKSKDCESTVCNLGCKVLKLKVPSGTKAGELVDIAVGPKTAEDAIKCEPYFGALVGRNCNRTAKGQFSILAGSKTTYNLALNNGPNHLHGGKSGWSDKIWTGKLVNSSTIELSYFSPDGDENYPGDVEARVTYELTSECELKMTFYAKSLTKCTPINLTNHLYFNLHFDHGKTILDHELCIPNLESFLAIDDTSIPLGEYSKVSNNKNFDFGSFKALGQDMTNEFDDTQMKNGMGYDHTFIIPGYVKKKKEGGKLRLAASLRCKESGVQIDILTMEPGLQVYTGNYLNGTVEGKNGVMAQKRTAICLETQMFPDCVNRFPEFHDDVFYYPGEEYRSETVFKFIIL